MNYNYSRYILKLANGLGWQIIFSKNIASWGESLVSIMRLKTARLNNYPKIIFISKDSAKNDLPKKLNYLTPSLKDCLPKRGWQARDQKLVCLWSHKRASDFICEIGDKKEDVLEIIKMQLGLYPVYHGVQKDGGMPFHSALVEYRKEGILLAGRGGIGKSTCCRRLVYPWQALCDDEAIIVRDKEKSYRVHPFPTWNNYISRRSKGTWDVQKHIPLKAIFFLEQSKKDQVIPVKQGQAAIFINESVLAVSLKNYKGLDNREKIAVKENIFHNSCELARVIPSFRLRVSLKGRFWENIEKVLGYG